jgi:hypothetical protein
LLAKSLEFDQESSALILVLTLGPALRHAQVVVELMQVADHRAIAQVHLQLLLEPAVHLDSSPVHLLGEPRLFEHRHEQIAQLLQLHSARTAAARLGAKGVDATFLKH